MNQPVHADDLLGRADQLKQQLGDGYRDDMVEALYDQAHRIADQAVTATGPPRWSIELRLDRILTHPVWGLPLMLVMLAVVFWLTIVGANVPSAFLAGLLIEEGGLSQWLDQYLGISAPAFLSVSIYERLLDLFAWVSAPAWLSGLLVDGVYLTMAWVVSVMLPPMAIFFPIFTLLEDLGYLPRVAFNLDWLFRACGAHGKQSLTMSMGFGCNAAGIIACRIIDSPREKLIAILTNCFTICNGRFPTVIAIAAITAAAAVPAGLISVVGAMTVVGVVLLGVAFTFAVSLFLSRTLLKGEASAFTLELPPYRRPSIMRVIYTSLIDRTIFVLGRAVVVAAPAGAVIWIVGSVWIGQHTIADHLIDVLGPLGWMMGLDGAILLAYIIAIPANEIVLPTILMLYMQRSRMIEQEGSMLAQTLAGQGWTTLTAVCLLVFVVLHNPCGTTIWTIWRETRSARWTLFGALMPVAVGIITCTLVAGAWRLLS